MIIRDQPFAEYQAIEAQNKSLLVEVERSPAHYYYAKSHRREATPAMQFGKFLHALVLEPHTIDSLYLQAPEGLRKGTKAHDALVIASQGRELVSHSQWLAAHDMRDAILLHPLASQCLQKCAEAEVSLTWVDPETELQCKARLDKWCGGVIMDLKTCEDASLRGFERAVAAYKYHWQAAMYLDGAKANVKNDFTFVFICVEKEPPYGVAVYTLEESFIEAGRQSYKNALRVVRECIDKNEWPCYSNQVLEIPAPKWMQA
jgi:hypothetical protein